jgi:hypothetical protein
MRNQAMGQLNLQYLSKVQKDALKKAVAAKKLAEEETKKYGQPLPKGPQDLAPPTIPIGVMDVPVNYIHVPSFGPGTQDPYAGIDPNLSSYVIPPSDMAKIQAAALTPGGPLSFPQGPAIQAASMGPMAPVTGMGTKMVVAIVGIGGIAALWALLSDSDRDRARRRRRRSR